MGMLMVENSAKNREAEDIKCRYRIVGGVRWPTAITEIFSHIDPKSTPRKLSLIGTRSPCYCGANLTDIHLYTPLCFFMEVTVQTMP